VKLSRSWGWVAVVVAAGATGCGPRHTTPGSPGGALELADSVPSTNVTAPPFAAPGEQMQYRLSIFQVEVAAFAIAVGDPEPLEDHRVIVVQAGVQSTGIAAWFKQVRTDFASWIDVETGRPLVSRVVETAGKHDPAIETSVARYHDIHDGKLPITMTAPDGTETVEDQAVLGADGVWDVPSILMYLRGWEAEVGAKLTTQVVRSRYVWRGQFRVAKRESRVTELGRLPTVRIDGIARRLLRDGTWEPDGVVRELSVWITDDADRVPVLVVGHTDFGEVKMELVAYRPGHAANLRGPR
jgi:hypothetical protein